MNGAAMLALQQLDSAIDHVEHRRQRLPERQGLADAQAALSDHRKQLELVLARMDEAQAVIDQCERDGNDLTAKRTSLEAKLKTVIAPREAEALMHEIESVNARRDEIDERELEALEVQSEADDARVHLQERSAPLQQELADAQAALAAAESGLNSERDSFLAQRGVAADALTAEESATYERMRATHRGVGIARLEGLRCTGCHLDLSRAEVDQIRGLPEGELAECPQCSRLLVP